jgi:hypothetical protein|tara:strand:+ start:230 stop:430 length:201 start_codon:yes stop_codon:yes gene_type:complete
VFFCGGTSYIHIIQPRGTGRSLGYGEDYVSEAGESTVEAALRAENETLKTALATVSSALVALQEKV